MERYNSQRNFNVKTETESLLELVAKKTGEVSFSWLYMSPVKSGFIKYPDLFNGSLTLFDLFKMNECLEYVSDFNENLRLEIEARNNGK